jgi:hypothetical protein
MFEHRCIITAISTLFFHPPGDVNFKPDVEQFYSIPFSIIAFACVAVSVQLAQSDTSLNCFQIMYGLDQEAKHSGTREPFNTLAYHDEYQACIRSLKEYARLSPENYETLLAKICKDSGMWV